MGEVRTKVFLENVKDRVLQESGHPQKWGIRHCEIDALVDTGAVMSLLPQDLVEKLGLQINGKTIVTLANETKVEFQRARLVSLSIGDRQMDTDCLVGPPQCEPLIGQIVLEQLDLIVDPLKKTLTPRPESPYLPSVKMK